MNTFRDLNFALKAIMTEAKTYRNDWRETKEPLENSTVISN